MTLNAQIPNTRQCMQLAKMIVLLTAVAQGLGVAAGGFHAFSCDTINATIGGNVFSAVPFPTLRGPKCPHGAGPTAGECMHGATV